MIEPQVTDLLFVGAAEIATCSGPPSVRAGVDPAGIRRGGALLTTKGRIAAIDEEERLRALAPHAERVDCSGGLLTPGLVDSHTHAVFGRWRADEFVLRSRGMGYMEIAAAGGGIHASVRDLRRRSEDELVELSLPRLAEMLHHGTTTAEIKSGYGLTTIDEIKILRVVQRLRERQPITLVSTFFGAHEIPGEYAGRAEAYIDLIVEEMLPAIAEEKLAGFCDVFMEPGVFDRRQSERILEAAIVLGLVPKLHADELEWSGGAELAAALGAASADHLGAISEAGIQALARSNTVATLLPTTLFFLGRRGSYAPGRRLLEAGANVALATDFNPGSSPMSSLPFAMTVACTHCGMEPSEALRAATAGGAAAIRSTEAGMLAPGAPADVALWTAGSVAELAYRPLPNPLRALWKDGQRVV